MHESQSNRKFVCSTCGKEFPKRVSLIGHEKFHLAEQRNQISEVATEAALVLQDSTEASAVPIESSDI